MIHKEGDKGVKFRQIGPHGLKMTPKLHYYYKTAKLMTHSLHKVTWCYNSCGMEESEK